ncbi:hypothetical protein PAEPH01_2935 [Pancytospora epiphaga]|nr:hypothetical protein PAEPH01_2935 [Pancytospora epiphaga]
MTEALKRKNKQFVWTDEMNKEFKRMKIVLRDLKGLTLPDYNRKFMLRTDACGTKMGAVLLQQDEKDEWAPVQWASKKFTTTKQRYGITDTHRNKNTGKLPRYICAR